MSGIRPFLDGSKAALASSWRFLTQWLPFEARLGIAARLFIAFGAVAVLAVVANAITEHGSSFIRAIEQSSGAPALANVQIDPDALPVVLDRVQRTAIARVGTQDAAQVRAYAEATEALESAYEAHSAAVATTLDAESLQSMDTQVLEHLRLAALLVRSADARRRLLNEFNAEFSSLDRRLKDMLERSWQASGKPADRQYLVEANRVMDEMRAHSAGLAALQGYGRDTVRKLVKGEAALAVILQDNERNIVRSFGDEWLAAARGHFEQQAWLRELLVRTDRQRQGRIEDFAQGHTALSAQVRRTTSLIETARALASARRQSAVALTAISEEEHRQRTLLVWLSVCVLLLLLATSVNTVNSVVMPVRRLLAATRRLASGESHVTVPRGGIKELDTLAVSFNQMAEQLTAAQEFARQYHGQLEAKVEERTRQLKHLAAHDPLTRLPNRRHLLARLDKALQRAAANGDLVGVYFLDLDHFKNINDSMGHVFGDRVLQAIADRLREAVASFGFSARLGGDEFTVVHQGAANVEEIERAGRLLVRAFQEPLVIDGRELLTGLSVGASVYPQHGPDPEALLRAADAALFHAKAQGRSQLSLFSPELLEVAASKFATEQGLRRAVEREEFELYFQPEVDLRTYETSLVEALLRWRLPGGAHASPQDFLPVAEDCGLIREIDDWVMKSAVLHAARWHATSWPAVRVAFNVSSPQLLDNRFVERLQNLLTRHHVPPTCIEIELTENVMQTGHQTIEALRQLRAVGVGVALDDFGTGYSSLVSLEQLPLSRVKLDSSLIASVDSSTRSQAIIRAIIALCQSLGLEITAEGVERREQLAWLLDHPAIHLQGYLLSRPVPEAELMPAIAAMPARMVSLLQPESQANTIQFAEYGEALRRKNR